LPATDGYSAARIEEEVVVTDKGCRVITLFPAEELPISHRILNLAARRGGAPPRRREATLPHVSEQTIAGDLPVRSHHIARPCQRCLPCSLD
jgi:hypothetical protein